MTLTLEEARARIVAALEIDPEGAPDDWWVSEAIRIIQAHQVLVERRRVYDVSTVGARLRTAREIVGLTQLQAADRIGFQQQQLGAVERGMRDIPADVFTRLCLSLGITEAWALGDSEEGGPPMPRGILRRQKLVNWSEASIRQKARRTAQAELERLRGLRPPKKPRPRPVDPEAIPEPPMPPCPRCAAPLHELDATFCIADGCGWPGAPWKPDVGQPSAFVSGTQPPRVRWDNTQQE